MRSIGLFLLALAVSACSESPYTNLDNEKLETLISEDVPLFDIRRASHWRQTGVIADSRLLTFVDANVHLRPDVATFTILNLCIATIVNAVQSVGEKERDATLTAVGDARDHIEADLHRKV